MQHAEFPMEEDIPRTKAWPHIKREVVKDDLTSKFEEIFADVHPPALWP